MPPRWSTSLNADETILLTVHQNGIPDTEELSGHQYRVQFTNGAFTGFYDPLDNVSYSTASGLCCAKLIRRGNKGTNEWRGPRHCLVYRNSAWVPIGSLL